MNTPGSALGCPRLPWELRARQGRRRSHGLCGTLCCDCLPMSQPDLGQVTPLPGWQSRISVSTRDVLTSQSCGHMCRTPFWAGRSPPCLVPADQATQLLAHSSHLHFPRGLFLLLVPMRRVPGKNSDWPARVTWSPGGWEGSSGWPATMGVGRRCFRMRMVRLAGCWGPHHSTYNTLRREDGAWS